MSWGTLGTGLFVSVMHIPLKTYLTFYVTGTARTGVLRAVIERASIFKTLSQSIPDVSLFSIGWLFPDRGPLF